MSSGRCDGRPESIHLLAGERVALYRSGGHPINDVLLLLLLLLHGPLFGDDVALAHLPNERLNLCRFLLPDIVLRFHELVLSAQLQLAHHRAI